MKRIFSLFLLSFSFLAFAGVYYVQDPAFNQQASDANPGTDIDRPWASWQKAFNTARPGDTVYFRGGTWYPRTDDYGNVTIYHPSSGYGHVGTKSEPVCFFAYPPDVAQGNFPVLDCRNTHPSTNNHVGLFISTPGYVEFKGLTVRNVRSWPQESGEMWCAGIMANDFRHLTLEQMTTSHIGGAGFFLMENDTLFLINCDSHNNCDSLDLEMPGNDADGFTLLDGNPESDSFNIAYIWGCRAWNNSDDGFELSNYKQLDVHDCWSWNNGDLEGDSNGFKLSYSHLKSTWKRRIYECIAACNERTGFTDVNLHSDRGPFMEFLNNTSYLCGNGFGSSPGQVFDCSIHPASVIYRNNISYAYTGPYPATFKACDFGYPSYVTQDHNSWIQGEEFQTEDNPAYMVSEDDFLSMDTAQLRWPRKADGSLPEITFLRLKSNSDLINKGIDAGLAYYGPAPDLGAMQYEVFSVELESPEYSAEFQKGDPILLQARVLEKAETIQELLFYEDREGIILGQGEHVAPSLWQFTWESDVLGYQDIRAVAYDLQSESATSAIARILINRPLLDERSLSLGQNTALIRPNPNGGFFFLELQEPLNESCDIHISSITGQLVAMERMEKDEIKKEMDLSKLPAGIYCLSLRRENQPGTAGGSLKLVKD